MILINVDRPLAQGAVFFAGFPTFLPILTLEYRNCLETGFNIPTAVVKKASQGDAEAQSLLYQQYNKAMYNICLRMAGNRADAEDLLQEAFMLAFKNLHQLKVAEQFGGWLKRIVVNECIRFSKKNFYWQEWDDSQHEVLVQEETEWWKTFDFGLIHQAIKGLPDGCRQIFGLFALEDYSHKEIATQLGISESTSKSQYFRAKQLLRERLTQKIAQHG